MEISSIETQNSKLITLSNLKSYLKKILIQKWYISKTNKNNKSLRESLLKNKPSNLKQRIEIPRQLQILFSRYRCDWCKSVGKYPRKLKIILNPSCYLWDSCEESIYHLLECCPSTLQYRK